MPVRSSAVTSPSHSNIFKIIYSAAVWYPDWSILSVQHSPHEEINRSVTWTGLPPPLRFLSSGILLFKILDLPAGDKTTDQSPWSSRVRNNFKHLWTIFFNSRCTFIRAYNVHCNTYILAWVFLFFLLDSGEGKGSYKALAASPLPEDSESWSCYSRQEEWQQKSVPASGVFF